MEHRCRNLIIEVSPTKVDKKHSTRCFPRWLRSGLIENRVEEVSTQLLNNIITLKVGKSYSQMKQGRNKYKRDWLSRQIFAPDLEAARDCINRVVVCS